MHVTSVHVSNVQQNTSKPDKLKRPSISEGINEADWVWFEDRWQRYKESTGLTGKDVVNQLWDQCWGFWTRNKSELHRINTNIKPYLQFSTEQKLSFKLKPRASQERSEAIIILHHIIKLQKKCVTKSNMRQSIIEIGKFIVMSVDC